MYDKDKQVFFGVGLQSSIQYDIKALNPYTLGKAYSMALTFEAKNVELDIENKSSFDISHRDHNNGKRRGTWKRSQRFQRSEGHNNTQ